jgi:hypothetical protein
MHHIKDAQTFMLGQVSYFKSQRIHSKTKKAEKGEGSKQGECMHIYSMRMRISESNVTDPDTPQT